MASAHLLPWRRIACRNRVVLGPVIVAPTSGACPSHVSPGQGRLTPKVSEEKLPLLVAQCQGPFPVEARPAQTGHVPPRRWYAGGDDGGAVFCRFGASQSNDSAGGAVVLLEWVDSTLPKAPTQCRWLFISTRPACSARTASVPTSQLPHCAPEFESHTSFPGTKPFRPCVKTFSDSSRCRFCPFAVENHPYPEPWSELRPNTSANSYPAQGNSCRPSAPLAHSLQPCSRILPPPFEFDCTECITASPSRPDTVVIFLFFFFVFSLPAATLIHTRSQISLNHGHSARPVDQGSSTTPARRRHRQFQSQPPIRVMKIRVEENARLIVSFLRV